MANPSQAENYKTSLDSMISYDNILLNANKFKLAGGGSVYNEGKISSTLDEYERFNLLDTPGQKYFKIMFYFGSTRDASDKYSSGLLAPTWLYTVDENGHRLEDNTYTNERLTPVFGSNDSVVAPTNINKRYDTSHIIYYDHNSAYSFLKINNEEERAEKLQHFVNLLSNISSRSPWYFNSVTGIQEALERKGPEDGKLDLNERKKITIKCLPDAFDNRIDTLLSLYRDITWSWTHKKEIIPANLRKFDMAIYIFESPENTWHSYKDETIESKISIVDEKKKKFNKPEQNTVKKSVIGLDPISKIDYAKNPLFNSKSESSNFISSFKMIEFHDCEFNYNSVKTAWGEISNSNGSQPEYQIEIFYNDCYEYTYNDVIARLIGDVILTDLFDEYNNENGPKNIPGSGNGDSIGVSKPQIHNTSFIELLNKRLKFYENTDTSNNESIAQSIMANSFSSTYGTLGNLSSDDPRTGNAKVDYKPQPHAGFITNAAGQIISSYKNKIKSAVTKALLGNIFTISLTKAWRDAKSILQGNLINGAMTVRKYVEEENARRAEGQGLFPDSKGVNKDGKKHKNYINANNLGILWDNLVETPGGFEDVPTIGHWNLDYPLWNKENYALIANKTEDSEELSNIWQFTGYGKDAPSTSFIDHDNRHYNNQTEEWIDNDWDYKQFNGYDKDAPSTSFIDYDKYDSENNENVWDHTTLNNEYKPIPSSDFEHQRYTPPFIGHEPTDLTDDNIYVPGNHVYENKDSEGNFSLEDYLKWANENSRKEADVWHYTNIFKDPFPREPKYSSIDEANENSRKRPI